MFDRIAPVYDAMNRVMTVGLDLRWRRLAALGGRAPGRPRARRACGTGDLAVADARAGAASVIGLDFSAADARACAAQGARDRVGRGRPARAAVRGRRASTPRPSGSASGTSPTSSARCASCAACCGPAARLAILEITQPRGVLKPFFDALVRPARAAARAGCCPAGPRTPTCRRRSPGSPAPRSSRAPRARGLRGRSLPAPRRLDRRAAHWTVDVGSTSRNDSLNARRRRHPGARRVHGRARGAARPGGGPPRPASRRSSRPRRSRPAASACGRCSASSPRTAARATRAARGRGRHRARPHGDARPRRPRRRRADAAGRALRLVGLRPRGGAVGRRLPVRVCLRRAVRDRRLARRRDPRRRLPLRSRAARRCSARQTRRPETTIDAYLERCALKTGKLFEAACLLGSGDDRDARRVRARARHRLPDRRRHPRLRRADPGDREDPRHRPARGHADDAAPARRRSRTRSCAARSPAGRSTARSSASPAPTRSPAPARRRSTTLRRPAACVGSARHREELEALTYAVVDRAS